MCQTESCIGTATTASSTESITSAVTISGYLLLLGLQGLITVGKEATNKFLELMLWSWSIYRLKKWFPISTKLIIICVSWSSLISLKPLVLRVSKGLQYYIFILPAISYPISSTIFSTIRGDQVRESIWSVWPSTYPLFLPMTTKNPPWLISTVKYALRGPTNWTIYHKRSINNQKPVNYSDTLKYWRI